MASKNVAVKINAGNDRNGNPRRGWHVYSTTGDYRGFVDEGYSGRSVIFERFPNVVELCTIPTTPTVYRESLHHQV
jgi:hypothetical protein